MCELKHDTLCLAKNGDIMCIWCEQRWKKAHRFYENDDDRELLLMRITPRDIRCHKSNKQWHQRWPHTNQFTLQNGIRKEQKMRDMRRTVTR
jgi:hypothetical protein